MFDGVKMVMEDMIMEIIAMSLIRVLSSNGSFVLKTSAVGCQSARWIDTLD